MRLPMVDCRSLIEFCRAFEQHKKMINPSNASDLRTHHVHSRHKKNSNPLNPLAHPFCDLSLFAAVDVIMLLLVLGAVGFLTVPYFKLIFREAFGILPTICDIVADVIRNAPLAYVVGLAVSFTGLIATIAAWEIFSMKSRKCGNPHCKALRKAVEFDIQLESEECVKYLPPLPTTDYGLKPLELGEDHKELEAELKRMAPLNGRTVLIFRAPCGCPAGRMEVWGPKKIRRIKK
ncbi:uncharacterized protein At5g19025-like [Cornus florida]|uniref:uncharacterized protein At5g19025-like n=1 Tax=Cornus florida TaxID=4283 RepID=UPI002896F154|nr:uncharacterized protein At5g19025-like [Cornus florida]